MSLSIDVRLFTASDCLDRKKFYSTTKLLQLFCPFGVVEGHVLKNISDRFIPVKNAFCKLKRRNVFLSFSEFSESDFHCSMSTILFKRIPVSGLVESDLGEFT